MSTSIEITIITNNSEKRRYGDVESAVEHINLRVHDNPKVCATQRVIEQIKKRVNRAIKVNYMRTD